MICGAMLLEMTKLKFLSFWGKVRSFRESFHFVFKGFFVKLYFKDFCIWRLFRKTFFVFWKPDFDLTAIRAGPKYSLSRSQNFKFSMYSNYCHTTIHFVRVVLGDTSRCAGSVREPSHMRVSTLFPSDPLRPRHLRPLAARAGWSYSWH